MWAATTGSSPMQTWAGSQQGCDPTVGAPSKRGKGRTQQQRGSAGTSSVGRREADTRTRGVVQDHADSPKVPRNHPSLKDPNRPRSSNSSTPTSKVSSLKAVAQRTLTALWTPTQKKPKGKMQPARHTPGGRRPVRQQHRPTPLPTTRTRDAD